MQSIQSIVAFAQDKKAEDIKVLDMREVANFCDYFVICTGTSDRQVKAIADHIELSLAELGVKIRYKHGLRGSNSKNADEEPIGSWALLDMGDIVVHVFEPNAREFYSLEYLWRDAPEVSLHAKKPRQKKT
ncbi:MAG: ribosome silencing factor [Candidatus Omnitrophica bacterium]|nr:ribosome silencing factor [Candidatus Omnitrophota bacterium]